MYNAKEERKKFPDEEEYIFQGITSSIDDIIDMVNSVFPVTSNPDFNYNIYCSNNAIHINSWSKRFFNEYYRIEILDNNRVKLTSYFSFQGIKNTTFHGSNFMKEAGYSSRLSHYNIKKIKLINRFGYDWEKIRDQYINKYSDSNDYYYTNPIGKYQTKSTETWIKIGKPPT